MSLSLVCWGGPCTDPAARIAFTTPAATHTHCHPHLLTAALVPSREAHRQRRRQSWRHHGSGMEADDRLRVDMA